MPFIVRAKRQADFTGPTQTEGIHCLSFTRDDVVRSGILKHLLERIEAYKASLVKH